MQISNFLPPNAHATVLDWAMLNEHRFQPSLMDEGASNPEVRQSLVLNDLGPAKYLLRCALKPRLAEFANSLGLSKYRFKGFDAQLAAHNDGAFYKVHIDTGPTGTNRATRLISAVYYFHNDPKGFDGGELRLFGIDQPGSYQDFKPENN